MVFQVLGYVRSHVDGPGCPAKAQVRWLQAIADTVLWTIELLVGELGHLTRTGALD